MRKKIIYCLIIMFVWSTQIIAQSIPSELWLVRDYEAGLDLGLHWQSNTLLKPYPLQSMIDGDTTQTSSLWIEQHRTDYGRRWNALKEPKVMIWPGVISQWKQGDAKTEGSDFRALFLFGQFEFRNWYANLYVRSATRADAFVNFTPHDRPISRAGMHAGEIDQALIGYRNSWAHVSFGRGRQIWGPFLRDNAILSSSSASYDHLAVQLFYKRWTLTYFHGFLEAIQDVQGKHQVRYVAGRALQYRPYRNGLIALGETSIYYGENRSFDSGFMNPLIPHIENEQNKRENIANGNLSNAIWFVAMDFHLPWHFRISGSVVFDEFQLDQADRDQGRPDAMAYQLRLAKSWVGPKSAFTLFGRYDAAGSYTYRHENPYTSFASRGLPLAMPQGSDFFQWTGGIRWILPYRISIEADYDYMEQGENNIKTLMYVPYSEFISIPFPSGDTVSDETITIHALWAVRPHIDCGVGAVIQRLKSNNAEQNQSTIFLRLSVHWPVMKSF
ncbi:capsule assembly Wzi family protein [bacterium]